MRKKFTVWLRYKVQFKSYQPEQMLLLPPSLGDLIEEHHLVRVVNHVVNAMDISGLVNQYKGGGTTAYHPRMLLKVLAFLTNSHRQLPQNHILHSQTDIIIKNAELKDFAFWSAP